MSKIQDFESEIVQNEFFGKSSTVLVRLSNDQVWQSSNEGYSWQRILGDNTFLGFYMNPYAEDRAYLITSTTTVHYTTNRGEKWTQFTAPSGPNRFGLIALQFHPLESDWLIWTGTSGECNGSGKCAAIAHYSTDNGRNWHQIEEYVKTCQWARDKDLRTDSKTIMCESYEVKSGDQRGFNMYGGTPNAAMLVKGSQFYEHKKVLFGNIIGFTKSAEYLLVAEVDFFRDVGLLHVADDRR